MKWLLLFLLSLSAFANQSHDTFVRDTALEQFKVKPDYSCFRYQNQDRAVHEWEKDAVTYSSYWMLIYKDDTAVLVAQPSSHCEQELEVKVCPNYWIRTVGIDGWFLPSNPQFVPCPKNFDKTFMKKFIRKHYAKTIKLHG